MAHLQNNPFRVSRSMYNYARILVLVMAVFIIAIIVTSVLSVANEWSAISIFGFILCFFSSILFCLLQFSAYKFENNKKDWKEEIESYETRISKISKSLSLSNEKLLGKVYRVIACVDEEGVDVKNNELSLKGLRFKLRIRWVELRIEVLELEIFLFFQQKPYGYEWWERYMLKRPCRKSYGRSRSQG